MITNLYSVYDAKADGYLPIFALTNDALAIRAIVDCMNDENHLFAKHPEDFILYRVGTFCDSTGTVEFEPTDTQKFLIGKIIHLKNNSRVLPDEQPELFEGDNNV